jgi:hypothetical protein
VGIDRRAASRLIARPAPCELEQRASASPPAFHVKAASAHGAGDEAHLAGRRARGTLVVDPQRLTDVGFAPDVVVVAGDEGAGDSANPEQRLHHRRHGIDHRAATGVGVPPGPLGV